MKASVIEACARAAHEANLAYCAALGDHSHKPWDTAPEWVRDSAKLGVEKVVVLGYTPEQLHAAWSMHKIATGWKYGPVKDAEKLEHPCLVPYDQLPEKDRAKDALYQAVVRAMAQALAAVGVA